MKTQPPLTREQKDFIIRTLCDVYARQTGIVYVPERKEDVPDNERN